MRELGLPFLVVGLFLISLTQSSAHAMPTKGLRERSLKYLRDRSVAGGPIRGRSLRYAWASSVVRSVSARMNSTRAHAANQQIYG
jgi:hypothetical protein